MALMYNRHAIPFIFLPVSFLLILTGCDKGPMYKYQNVNDVTPVSDAKGGTSETANKEGSAPTSTEGSETNAANPGDPASGSSEPALPEVTVNELLQNDKHFNSKKIKVTGNLGQIMSLSRMSFIINKSDDLYIEFSYGQMSDSDKFALTNKLGPMSPVVVIGVWDVARKVLIGESLAM